MQVPGPSDHGGPDSDQSAGGKGARPLTIIQNYLREHSLRGILGVVAEQYLGTLLRSLPGAEGIALRSLLYRGLFKRLDGFAFIYQGAYIDHCSGISAGRALSINSMAYVSGRGGLTIGDGVLIGPHAVVVSDNHNYKSRQTPISEQGHQLAPTFIGDDCMICANSIVLAGVRIATGTVVSSGAVVTKNTEPYSIVAGVPATHRRYRGDQNSESPSAASTEDSGTSP